MNGLSLCSGTGGLDLALEIAFPDYHCIAGRLLKSSLPTVYRKGRSMFRRKLNPGFVCWLMGLPDGWLDEERTFSASEMESFLSRQRACLAFLLEE